MFPERKGGSRLLVTMPIVDVKWVGDVRKTIGIIQQATSGWNWNWKGKGKPVVP